jgi:hypothetical protein
VNRVMALSVAQPSDSAERIGTRRILLQGTCPRSALYGAKRFVYRGRQVSRAGGRIPFRGRGAPCQRTLRLRPDVVGVKRCEVPRRCRPMRRHRAKSCWCAAALFRQCLCDRAQSVVAARQVGHLLGHLNRGGKVAGFSTATARTFGAALSPSKAASPIPRGSDSATSDPAATRLSSAGAATIRSIVRRRATGRFPPRHGTAKECAFWATHLLRVRKANGVRGDLADSFD